MRRERSWVRERERKRERERERWRRIYNIMLYAILAAVVALYSILLAVRYM